MVNPSDEPRASSAQELAAAIVERLPEHSLHERARLLALAANSDADCGHCPRCGRSLPFGSIPPAFQSFGHGGAIGIPITEHERVAACLVDGPRGRRAQDLPRDELVGAAIEIHRALLERGWKHWAKQLGHALVDTDDPGISAQAIGQALEALRQWGPLALEPGPEVEVIVTSLARYWPQEPRA